jgi:4-amino-4-deoxy-L-arabinose transferase-like glycosyltransferase
MIDSFRVKAAVCAGLLFASFLVYWGLWDHGFIAYDDPQYLENAWVKAGLSLDNLVWALESGHAANWHPVTWLSHMLDVQLFGLEPAGHHLVSLVLHGLNACLLFLVLHRMTGCRWRSALVAALFAVHPMHVESVAWAAERKDLLCALFALLGLWCYAARGGAARYAALLSFFVLGLMSKPMLVTFPLVLLLLDIWPLGRWRPWGGSPGSPLAAPGVPIQRPVSYTHLTLPTN